MLNYDDMTLNYPNNYIYIYLLENDLCSFTYLCSVLENKYINMRNNVLQELHSI